MQLTFFFFLPSMPLTGFMFAFRSIPDWAQAIGEALPLSHFLRIARGIMLKGNGWAELLPISGPSPVHAGGRRRGACQVSADGRLGAA